MPRVRQRARPLFDSLGSIASMRAASIPVSFASPCEVGDPAYRLYEGVDVWRISLGH